MSAAAALYGFEAVKPMMKNQLPFAQLFTAALLGGAVAMLTGSMSKIPVFGAGSTMHSAGLWVALTLAAVLQLLHVVCCVLSCG